MKSYRLAALLALSLFASLAHAGRDELLIQQTRKNQLTHDAHGKKEQQEQARQQKQEQDAAPAGQAQQRQAPH